MISDINISYNITQEKPNVINFITACCCSFMGSNNRSHEKRLKYIYLEGCSWHCFALSRLTKSKPGLETHQWQLQ